MGQLGAAMSTQDGRMVRTTAFVSKALDFITGAGIFLLMAIVFTSVFFRYVLNAPLLSSDDYLAVFLGLTIFAAYPSVCRDRKHISVDLFNGLFERAPRLNAVRLILIDLFVVCMTLFMAWCLYWQAEKYQRRGSTTAMADIPLAPVTYVFVALLVASAVLLAVRTFIERGTQTNDNESISI